MKKLRAGVEGLVTGLMRSGVRVVTGYPGGPATPILELFAARRSSAPGTRIEWSVNEKQATALGCGAALAGSRAAVVMKHVGLNVASDALVGTTLNDLRGGLVVIVGDDPGGGLSQNEQDSRCYAYLLGIPFLEPADAEEAEAMVLYAFELSEEYALPVLIRFTNRLLADEEYEPGRVEVDLEGRGEQSAPREWFLPVDIPGKHRKLHGKLETVGPLLWESRFNLTCDVDSDLAILTSGAVTRRVEACIETLGTSCALYRAGVLHPLPREEISGFARHYRRLLVVEDGEPWIEWQLRSMLDLPVRGKLTGDLPREGKLTDSQLEEALINLSVEDSGAESAPDTSSEEEVAALPANCPIHYCHTALKEAIAPHRDRVVVVGDTGCICAGSRPPYNTMDAFLCMGVSASLAAGLNLAGYEGDVVAVMGDSSFLHSGLQSLMNAVYNRAEILFLIFDNGVTGQTGGQYHPGSGLSIDGEDLPRVELEAMVAACRVEQFRTLAASEVKKNSEVIASYLEKEGVRVIIIRGVCPEGCDRE